MSSYSQSMRLSQPVDLFTRLGLSGRVLVVPVYPGQVSLPLIDLLYWSSPFTSLKRSKTDFVLNTPLSPGFLISRLWVIGKGVLTTRGGRRRAGVGRSVKGYVKKPTRLTSGFSNLLGFSVTTIHFTLQTTVLVKNKGRFRVIPSVDRKLKISLEFSWH